MIPQGVEVRPELQVRGDVLAFGFSRANGNDAAFDVLGDPLFDHIQEAAVRCPARFVVADVRNIQHLSAVGVERLLSLQSRLQHVQRQLIVLTSDPVEREVFSVTGLDKLFSVVADEAGLRELVDGMPAVGPTFSQPGDEVLGFTAEELAELDATGGPLDDAIRMVEQLRG